MKLSCINIFDIIQKYINKLMCNDDVLLEHATMENTEWLSFNGQDLKCKCVDVYDADTVTLAIPFHGSIYKRKCRLLGIDAAEIRTKNEEEKAIGKEGKEFLSDMIKNKVIYSVCGKDDKFGRLLVTLYMNQEVMETKDELINNKNQSINQILIDNNYAYVYNGQAKTPFEDWFSC
jgi:endonuclease YncB( thermonuclease family)